jgi:DNA polymerase III alpha subunit (gram-positive type)
MNSNTATNDFAYVVDTETTGLGTSDVVIEICIRKVDLSNVLHTETTFTSRYGLPPGVEIHHGAYEAHKISPKDLESLATGAEHLALDIEREAPELFSDTPVAIIGHNISFDIRMIQQTVGRNLAVLPICTMAMYKKLALPAERTALGRKSKLTLVLETMYPHLAEQLNANAHSAKGDVELTQLLLNTLLGRLPADSGISTFEDLHSYLTFK